MFEEYQSVTRKTMNKFSLLLVDIVFPLLPPPPPPPPWISIFFFTTSTSHHYIILKIQNNNNKKWSFSKKKKNRSYFFLFLFVSWFMLLFILVYLPHFLSLLPWLHFQRSLWISCCKNHVCSLKLFVGMLWMGQTDRTCWFCFCGLSKMGS